MIPAIGFGTFRMKDEDAYNAVRSALEVGYRHIDTAAFYDNEAAVGRALKDSDIPREKLFVTTKVWHDRLSEGEVTASIKESLEKLGLDYLDLVLIHWPSPNDEVPMESYIGELDQAREDGLTRHIGVSNFTVAHLEKMLTLPGGRNVITNQIEVHPFLANRKVADFCEEKGIKVTAYMPLAVGKVMDDDTLKDIAEKHDATPADIALAWVSQRDIAVIPSSTNPKHQKSNLDAIRISLTADDMTRIDELDRAERIASPDFAPAWDE
ncbi:2,5-didehydrogluconate reductase DkgB [Larsenimonas rhizosphaerae]|uniref:2,5-didehydrogluconate reductase DkgB n=1 Tax=Larsenimonas rhizosphaerae TaxID=2944682 RepID=UPI0020345897|nr:2,5-didehydrogluconate reductase DkgB [Larsenimonas rhizosphaerae]MCM2130208.1 2,5-didehydrogluconate reductase DkgB [Larsenimonas rhizosphaerae]